MRTCLFFLLMMVVFSCKKAELQINAEQHELQEWLANEGKYFVKGEIKVNITNSLVTGKLDWNQVYNCKKNGYEFWLVPFVFSYSSMNAKKVITDAGNLPTNFYLIFRKRSNGLIEARLRMRSLNKGGSLEDDVVYESYYGLDGNYIAEIMWHAKKFSILTEYTSTNSNQRSSGCTQEVSTTSSFNCYGDTPNTTVCYYIIRRRVTNKCDFDQTPEQQETISWIANDDYSGGWQETEENETRIITKDTSISNHPEVNCVYDNLMNSNLSNGLKSILASFDNSDVYNVTFKVEQNLGSDGRTNYQGNNNFIIKVNGDQAYTDWYPRIWLASTFIHEAFHAKLRQKAIALLGSDEIATWPKNIDDMTLSELANYFQLSGEKTTKWNDIGHDWMVNNIDQMATSIQEFVQNYYPTTYAANTGSGLTPYRALAFMGLKNSKFYTEKIGTVGTESEIAQYRSALNDGGVCSN